MTWDAVPSGKRGRQQAYSDAAIQTCLTRSMVFGMALRQTTVLVASLLRLADLDWLVPDVSTLSRRQKTLVVSISCRKSSEPLHLLIDSIGINALHAAKKVTASGTRANTGLQSAARCTVPMAQTPHYLLHGAINEETLEIRAVEVTGAGVGDAPAAGPPCSPNCCRKSRPVKTLPL